MSHLSHFTNIVIYNIIVDASLKFGLQPGVGILIQQQLDGLGQQLGGIGQQLAQLHAMNTNTRIMSHNRRYATDPIRPLVKSVSPPIIPQCKTSFPQTAGDGHQAALMIHGPPALPQAAQNYQPNAQIGQVPNPWNPNLDSLQHLEILQLVIFYNDNFGIIVGDQVGTRRQKVRNWLVDQA